jgi:DNA segregation ATPase FtsK/SpoIIIE-like protein
VLWGALKVGEISFDNDEAFVSIVISESMRWALEKLSQFNWFLRIESSLDIPGLKNVTWRSSKGKNGLVLELEPDTIDFSQTFPYPNLYASVVPERNPLDVILGKDEKWRDVLFNLATAPHLLVAGATGKGKSVWMNNIIVSLLKNVLDGHPIEQIFLIDPKKVEFGPYKHLPYTTYCEDLYEAVNLLERMVREMDRRYKLLETEWARGIDGYREKGGDMKIQVAIVDEFADIICHFDKDLVLRFEKAVQRIAQLWRAAGIHIILATQRPSADVIKPIIRSNITARLGFGTAGQADSDIILQDKSGLLVKLHRGECYLSLPSGITHLKTYFLSDDEVKSFIEFYAMQSDSLAATPLSITDWDPKIGDYLVAFRAHLKEIWVPSPELKSPDYLLFARLLSGGGYKSRADLRLFATEVGIKHRTIDAILQIFRERELVLFDDALKVNYLSSSIIKDQPSSLIPLYTAIQEGLWM